MSTPTQHTTGRLAPWADWFAIPIENCKWFKQGVGVYLPVAGDFALDQLDAASGATYRGSALPKITFGRPTASTGAQNIGFWHHIALPGFVVGRDQALRLASWTGARDTQMDDGGRRIGLHLEVVLASRSESSIGYDLTGLAAMLKPKGWGGTLIVAEGFGEVDDDTEDAPICSNVFNGCNFVAGTFPNGFGAVAGTAFPDLSLPSDDAGQADPNLAPTFAPNGACRVQWVFDIPNTVMPGTALELAVLARYPITQSRDLDLAIQWQYARYRWITGGPGGSYPTFIGPNAGAQCEGPTDTYPDQPYDQPYIDDGAETP